MGNLSKAQSWNRSENRNPASPVSTELLVPFKAARCPGCEKIVPLIYFEKEDKCPLCKFDLKKPEPPPTKTDEKDDNDKDGMSNMYERQCQLNPEDASDKMTDPDEDGFPNLVEYLAEPQTKANDPKSHPLVSDRLYLAGIKRTKLMMQLYNVMKNNSEDKEDWLVQVKVLDKRRKWKSKFLKLGATLKLGKGIYEITDIIFKEEERFNKKLKQPMKTNTSEVLIQNTLKTKDKPITVFMKKSVYENLALINLKDFFTEKSYRVKTGDTFTVGNSISGMVKYTVVSINKVKDKTKSITIKDKKGTKYIIGKISALEAKIEECQGKTAKPISDEFGMDPRSRRKPPKNRPRFPNNRF